MKKSTLFLFLILAFSLASKAQEWVSTQGAGPSTIFTELVSSSETSIEVHMQVPGFYATSVETPRGDAWRISIPRTVSTFDAGEPQLPVLAIPAIIGDNALMQVRIKDSEYIDFENYEVAPSKGDFPRTIDPDDVPYTYGSAYSNNAFFPEQQVSLYEPYILRDFRGQNMVVYPFAYNPVTKTLRVYYDLTIEMYRAGNGGENQLTRKSNDIHIDEEINAIYNNHFINFEAAISRYTPMNETGELLIICHDAFMSAMEPFVNWKKQIGRPTTIVGTSTTGTSYTAIKNYIQTQYGSNNNISHILLVGDVQHIPGFPYEAGSGYYGYSGKSDNMYGQVAGNDLYNDIIVGRFSAEEAGDVTTQVNKVIHYEKEINASDTWLSTGSGVATTSGGGHFNEQDWEHIDNIRTDLLAYNYTEVYRDYKNAGGANSSAATLSQHINDGLSIINYCNHGSETSWAVFNYSNSNVNALTNDNKLPIIWSVACLNGKYDHYTPCFGETWLRAKNNTTGAPTGAIGTMMSYISQPWEPPMYGQDEMVDVLVETYSNNIKRTMGGVSFDGNMKVLDQYGQNNNPAKGTYLGWILFGDPTLTLRNATPADMGVSHAASMNSTATSFTVNASNGNGALATLTRNNEIMGSATINNGSATISFTAPGQSGTATLTVFGYNKITYVGTVSIGNGGPTPLSVQVTATPSTIAEGGSSSLKAIASGGNGSYTYNWTPATGLNNSNIQSPTATPTQSTTYTCTVTSNEETATGSCTVTVVNAPTNLTATIQNINNVRLNWTASNPATSYKVYRNNAMIAQGVTGTTYMDNNLTPGSYNYQVATVYNGVESPKSNTATVNIAAPLNITVTANPTIIPEGGSSQLQATATGGEGNYSYSWAPATGLNNTNTQSPIATPTQTTTYTCTVTSNGQTATGACTVTVVKTPGNVVTEIVNTDSIQITWTTVAPANSYKLYRNGTLLASNLSNTQYTDADLDEGEYCYQATATYQNIESPKSEESCKSILFCAAPENFHGQYHWEENGFGVMLNWDKADVLNIVSEFRIYRSDDNDNYEQITSVPADPSNVHYTYFDEITMGTYFYKLSAYYSEMDCEVFYKDANGSDHIMVEVTAINNHKLEVALFPNPTKEVLHIIAKNMSHISVTNSFGQMMFETDLDADEFDFNTKQILSSGVYMIQIQTKQGVINRSFVVE